MSLVNDMLRDLDARRRDAPAGNAGTERLVPAVEYPRGRGQSVPTNVWLIAAMIVSILLVVTLYFVLDTGTPRSLTVNVPMQSAGAAQQVSSEAVLGLELERLNRRMQELEATNRRLQEEQAAQISVQETAGIPAVPASPINKAPEEIAVSGQTIQPAWTPREWVSETEVSATQAQRAMPAPVQQRSIASTESLPLSRERTTVMAAVQPSGDSTLLRSPRELTLSERDRLQVQQSLDLWQKGQQAAALSSLQDYTVREPMAHQTREILAKLLLQQGDSITALEVTDAGLQLAPSHMGFRKIKARVLLAAGLPAEATALLDANAPSVGADPEYHDLLATAQLSSGKYADAARSYGALVQVDQQQSRWWYGLAAAQDGEGRTYEAAQAYEQALKLGSLSAGLRQSSQQRIASIRQN